jgi:glutamate racemase
MSVKPRLRRAIGVFDSGVGGLTVLQALRRRMPHRDFVYLGDTARVPYGRKPPQMVAQFAREITGFLCGLGVDGVVVASNTASAVALPLLAERCPTPVWGVIDPGVEAAIGACPMLVHVVEEGLADSPESGLLVRHYLSGRPEIDTLVLGCAHYPLLRGPIERAVGRDVTLLDSAAATAERVSTAFGPPPRCFSQGKVVYFVTGDPAAFAHTAKVIGGVEGEVRFIELSELRAVA